MTAEHLLKDNVAENSVAQKYSPAIFTFAVLVLGGLQGLLDAPITTVILLQFTALIVGTALTVLFPLAKGRWAGAFKVGAEVLLTAIALVIPFALAGHITRAQVVLVVIGVVKALATQVGVTIRTDATVAAAPTPVVIAEPEDTADVVPVANSVTDPTVAEQPEVTADVAEVSADGDHDDQA